MISQRYTSWRKIIRKHISAALSFIEAPPVGTCIQCLDSLFAKLNKDDHEIKNNEIQPIMMTGSEKMCTACI